jgi:hypothetical protein
VSTVTPPTKAWQEQNNDGDNKIRDDECSTTATPTIKNVIKTTTATTTTTTTTKQRTVFVPAGSKVKHLN